MMRLTLSLRCGGSEDVLKLAVYVIFGLLMFQAISSFLTAGVRRVDTPTGIAQPAPAVYAVPSRVTSPVAVHPSTFTRSLRRH